MTRRPLTIALASLRSALVAFGLGLLMLVQAGCADAGSIGRNKEAADAARPVLTSYEQASSYARQNTTFKHERIDTSRSSFIRHAEYHQGRSQRGYLILDLQGREYIYAGVPLEVWKEFKAAPSFGTFYNEEIKGRYLLTLGERAPD